MPLRIAIFDDNKDIRESISLLLQTDTAFEVVGVFSHVLDCIADIRACKPNVILMDIEMPEMSGIEAVKLISKEFPDIQILMQTVFEDDDSVFDAVCFGASGYILKNQLDTRLPDAIHELREGGSPMSPVIARKILTRMQQVPEQVLPQAAAQDYHLSAREKEVLACVVNGLSYKMIAAELFVSLETIRTHIKRIYKKLQVATLTELVHKAIREKIV